MFEIPRSDEPRRVTITEACITKGAQPEIETIEEEPTSQSA